MAIIKTTIGSSKYRNAFVVLGLKAPALIRRACKLSRLSSPSSGRPTALYFQPFGVGSQVSTPVWPTANRGGKPISLRRKI